MIAQAFETTHRTRGREVLPRLVLQLVNPIPHDEVTGVPNKSAYGNAASGMINSTFAPKLASVANVNPGRMFQFQARVKF